MPLIWLAFAVAGLKGPIDSCASERVASPPTLECDVIIKLDYWRNVAIP